jgi:hypothetical protein
MVNSSVGGVLSINGILDFFRRLVFRTEHNVSELGSVSVLRRKDWKATSQLLPLKRANFSQWTSFRNVVFCSKYSRMVHYHVHKSAPPGQTIIHLNLD